MPESTIHLDSPWCEFLTEIDRQLSAPARLVCIGGFVVTAIHGFSRSTSDLDYVQCSSELPAELLGIAGPGSALHKRYHLFVEHVGIVTMPYNFEERLLSVDLPFEKLKLIIPELYDLVLSKLERNSPKDQADVQFLAEKYRLSFSVLCKRFDNELDFMANPTRHITTLNFWRDWFQQ